MANERRRSDRLMLTIPLRVHGYDPMGGHFEVEARTIAINRHGARIQIAHPLYNGQTVRLANLLGHREAEFRVVGPVSPLTAKGGEWGVECLDSKANIWGIQFPPPDEGQTAESKALLECRRCHTVALKPLSLVEVEVLETSGFLAKQCPHCCGETPWGYAEAQMAMLAPPGEPAMLGDTQVQAAATAKADQRRHHRVSLQLPVRIHDYYGGEEICTSENVSKGGFCFVSEKSYLIGQGIMVVCPYTKTSQTIEVRARIVRRRDIEGSNRKIYGVRYAPEGR